MSSSMQGGVSLSTAELAKLLGTNHSMDLRAIDDLSLSERQWLESETLSADHHWRQRLLAATRLRLRHLLAPCEARSHTKDLQSWLHYAMSSAAGTWPWPEPD